MRRILLLFIIVVCAFASAQDSAKLVRSVEGRVLSSRADPAVTLTVADGFQYAGGQVIDLFKIAEAELHYFVDADKDKAVRRFYWIQFEHYYPDNKLAHDYSSISQQPLQLGRLQFAADAKVSPDYFFDDNRPGSDSEATRKFLQQKGYKLGGRFARARLFYLTDSTKRKELMIIYGEALPKGASEEDAKKAVLRHAQENIQVK